ncbi:MAG: bifunctional DNA primase/polymerase [Methylobacter sp.]|nr:bifunctional DNA primase/polymerase [Methylobacter sp.]
MSLLNAALHYAENGIPVFPVHGIDRQGMCTCQTPNCPHPGKHPIFKGGFKIATTHQQQITQWWTKHPDANIGVPTGALSGWYVVDVDHKNRGIDNYKRFNEQHANDLPSANLKVRTGGGGCHLIYGQPSDGQAVGSGTNIGRLQSVDFRGDGGYIVVPPSSHVSGRNYRWQDNCAFKDSEDLARLQPLPAILADLVNLSARTHSQVAQDSVNEGGRNNYLFKQACRFRRDGVTDEELLTIVCAENQATCHPPLDLTEVEQIVGSALKMNMNSAPSRTDSSQAVVRHRIPSNTQSQHPTSSKSKTKQDDEDDAFDKLMDIAAEHEFWTDSIKKEFVTFWVPHKSTNNTQNLPAQTIATGHYENWPIDSSQYRRFLDFQYRTRYGKRTPQKDLDIVLAILKGDVLFSENSYDTHVRTARDEDRIFIDLTDGHWNVVEITATGWSKFDGKVPVKFVRTSNVQPMPIPDPSGDFDSLRQVFRLKSENDYILLAAWLMFAFVERGPYPILALEGAAGSSKTVLTKQIKRLIDPGKPVSQVMPKDFGNLFISANNSHLIAIDNLSKISQDMSDILCGIATGTSFSKRGLYTDGDEVIFDVCKPIVLNGVNSVIEFSDLADRTLRISLPQITSTKNQSAGNHQGRLSNEEVEELFQYWRPKMLGAIFTALQAALPRYKTITDLPDEIRMMDFAQWAVAAGNTLATGEVDILAVITENRQHSAAPLLEDSVLNSALLDFMQIKKSWSGTPTELFEKLGRLITVEEAKDKSFPKQANQLTKELNKSITTLKQFGIDYSHSESSNHKKRIITLDYTPITNKSDDVPDDDTEQKPGGESKATRPTNRYRRGDSSVKRVRPNQYAKA